MNKSLIRNSRSKLIGWHLLRWQPKITPALILLLSIVVGYLLLSLFGHQLIKAMYEGKSLNILNKLISANKINTLDYYFQRANYLFLRICVFSVIFYLISSIFFISLSRRWFCSIFFICFAILLIGIILHTVFSYGYGGPDDAYITYRYARNFAQGHGIVFNPGERVEGHTTLLYVLLMAFGWFIAGGNNVYLFSCVINTIFAILALFVFYKYVKKQLGDIKGALAIFLFALFPSIWMWAGGGKEVTLVLLIQLAIWTTTEQLLDKQKRADLLLLGLLMVLSIMARADGFILPGIVIMYLLFRRRWQAVLYCSVCVILTMTIYTIYRYNYYGYLLPNTYYAKVYGSLSLRVASAIGQLSNITVQRKSLLFYLPVFLLGSFKILKGAIEKNRQQIPEKVQLPILLAVSLLIYWVYIGGDPLGDRFLIFVIPLGIFVLFKLIEGPLSTKIISIIIIVALLQLNPLYNPFNLDQAFIYSFSNKYDHFTPVGKFLRERYSDKILATPAAGKIPYFSGLKTIDMLGLNDEHIAHKGTGKIEFEFFKPGHNKSDLDYVFSKSPDILVLWVESSNMDSKYPMLTKGRYEKEGYALKYLFNAMDEPYDTNMIDVKGLSEDEIGHLIDNKKYKIVVLEKNR